MNGACCPAVRFAYLGFVGALALGSLSAAWAGAPCGLTCPLPVTQDTDPGQCGAVVNFAAPATTGTCGPIVCTPPSGSFFPEGPTVVQCSEQVTQTTVYSTGNITLPVPSAGTTGSASVNITVPDAGTITDVDVRVRLNHTFDGDLEIRLVHPDSTAVLLSENRGGGGDNFGSGANDCSGTPTVFDDEAATAISAGSAPFAGSFQPDQPLSGLDGKGSAGTWQLQIDDEVGGDSGTLFCVSLVITRFGPGGAACSFSVTVNDNEPPAITCPADHTAAQGPFNFPPPTTDDNCPDETVACVPPSGSVFPPGPTPVTCTATDESGNTATCSFIVTGQAIAIPTLSAWSRMTLLLLLAGVGLVLLHRLSPRA